MLVAAIATIRFYRAGRFSFPLFWPFAVASVPPAFLGGPLTFPGSSYRPAVGVVLLFAAYRLLKVPREADANLGIKPVPVPSALVSGAGIGLLSGLTGTGGGIFLSPLLLFMGWAETRESAGISAAFILVNSIAGLAGLLTGLVVLPPTVPFRAAAAVAVGLLGSGLGSRYLGSHTLRRLLAAVLVIAGSRARPVEESGRRPCGDGLRFRGCRTHQRVPQCGPDGVRPDLVFGVADGRFGHGYDHDRAGVVTPVEPGLTADPGCGEDRRTQPTPRRRGDG